MKRISKHAGSAPDPVHQRGQVLPLALTGVVLAAVLMFVLTNTGNRVTEKSMVVNAADAAAYSGAAWVAEHLNFMAYTNRAMIANHVGVGHLVAYVSWMRYVEDTADKIEDIAQFVPYVNVVAQAVEEFATALRELAEATAEVFIPSVDLLNAFYAAAQIEAHATLGVTNIAELNASQINNLADTPMDRLMQATAANFDPAIRVNDRDSLSKIKPALAAPVTVALAIQRVAVPAFVSRYNVSDRDGEFVKLVEQTFGRGTRGFFSARGEMSAEWLNDREWRFGSIRKRSRTRHSLTDDLADWNARDRLRRKTFFGFGPTVTLASGRATAREFHDDYRGIFGYYNLRSEKVDHHELHIVAYASKLQSEIPAHDVFGLETPDLPVSGFSIARVEHVRPSEGFELHKVFNAGAFGFLTGAGEYANLYNPFWQARIVGTQYFDLTKVSAEIELLPDDLF